MGLLMHAIVHSADIQDRDGGGLVIATLFGLYPFLLKLFADGGYQGPVFQSAVKAAIANLNPSLTPLSNFPTLSISCELKKSRVALHPRRKGWLGTFSAPLRIPLKGPYGSGKSQWGLDNIMALQIIFQNTAAISAIFPEFVTVSSGKVLKMG